MKKQINEVIINKVSNERKKEQKNKKINKERMNEKKKERKRVECMCNGVILWCQLEMIYYPLSTHLRVTKSSRDLATLESFIVRPIRHGHVLKRTTFLLGGRC